MGVSISGRNDNDTEKTQSRSFLLISLLIVLVVFLPPHSLVVFAGADGSSDGIAGSNFNDAAAPPPRSEASPVRPGVAVVVAVLTCIFSITFLLVLYARHCKVGVTGGGTSSAGMTSAATLATGRKNSGIDRAVVESLPVFRFGSLSGRQKEGLECAVCLNRFEGSEVLRLLPKCKHAFHVECVDTWLDGHSTCPLCRYRVDPEDVLLVLDPHHPLSRAAQVDDVETGFHRVSGRHSSAGERPPRSLSSTSFSLRRSLDGFGWRKKSTVATSETPTAGGCFDRYHRKDGMLLTREEAPTEKIAEETETPKNINIINNNNNSNSNSDEIVVEVEADDDVERRTRLEHRINVVVSGGAHGGERWSDVQPSDLLYLRSEMLMMMSSRRCSPSSSNGRSVINTRSVSEITGLSRFHPSFASGRDVREGTRSVNYDGRHRERQAGLLSRWLGWVSSSHSVPAVRSAGTNHPSTSSPSASTPPAPTTRTTAV
uniref:RING-type E3 ubiquitin transferase n=1 Tax=Hypericum perforatum TaxID=65561 RepID=D9ZHD8_HYPPE|nr:ring H2 finger protein [Hypericum perforatum]